MPQLNQKHLPNGTLCVSEGVVLKEPLNLSSDQWSELTSEAGAVHDHGECFA
ncbi:MAG: hypothetical protein MUO40_01775 [Anaerolineaceae bacterium]|nr:hypothetical protein [Anaerolineaceae bacterium]